MKDSPSRAVAAVIILNLVLFLAVVTAPAFQAAHHHWIFPVGAALVCAQWAATFLRREAGAARSSLLSVLLFLLVMGVIRHATILTCFDRCGFKLAAAAALSAPVFWTQALLGGAGWWSARRSRLAALGSALWALYLAAAGLHLTGWAMDLSFAALATALWLARSRAEFLLASVGIASGILIRELSGEWTRIALGAVWGAALPLAYVDRVQSFLDACGPAPVVPAPRVGRILLGTGVFALLAFYAIGPTFLMTDHEERQKRLTAMAPAALSRDPKTLSPLAARLRAHVVALAGDIGERDAYQPKEQARARDYVFSRFSAAGYRPRKLPYAARWLPGVKNGTEFHNVEAVLTPTPADRGPIWVVGAHYDSASGTPGADDNASGVAVLLEAARLLKERRPTREIRFVAFGTEEPPSFGTRNMGSARYADALVENGAVLHGMISLEMLGYYNPRKGAQLYPPFMQLFYPDHGDYAGVTADIRSRGLLREFLRDWRRASSFPLQGAVLPGPLSGLALSDQLNYWDKGYPALMLSDTAFYRNPHYHEHTDTPDTLDYEKMAEVTRALVEVLDPAADR